MLNEEEINKIKQLIKQGKSNYRIWQLTDHSPNTAQGIREEMEKTGQEQIHEEEMIFKNPTDIIKGIIKEIEVLIETKQLERSQEKKWEKRKEQLREMLKEEVDDRIANERVDAVQKRDLEWNQVITTLLCKKGSRNTTSEHYTTTESNHHESSE